ncbi:MAG: exodeoxyribonuclease III [Spirochaetales bacterium]|nr:exodeoxyribonuclease III [Spirochaetales bacterium]
MKTIISWNVNGIRAAETKGLYKFLKEESPDILCLQETKAQKEQLTEKFINPEGYTSYWVQAVKKGYSGVVMYVKNSFGQPISVFPIDIPEFDDEGRALFLEFPDFTLLGAYFPNSQPEGKRLDYKLRFCNAVLEKCSEFEKSGKNVIITGDYNIAHKPIDLANPKRNEKNPGYLPEEREWMDVFTEKGWVDTFRQFSQEPNQYTWWSYRFHAREKNIGWRLDYFCVNKDFSEQIKSSTIMEQVMGSDHCPVKLEIK